MPRFIAGLIVALGYKFSPSIALAERATSTSPQTDRQGMASADPHEDGEQPDHRSDEQAADTGEFYIETDPTAFFFQGFTVAVRRSSSFTPKLSLGIGYYQTVLPSFYIESTENNEGKGWQARNQGVDVFADYFIFDPNKSLSVGVIASVYRVGIEREGEKAAYTSLVGTVRAGYLWRPFPWKTVNSFYVYPWLGVAANVKIGGDNEVQGETFELPPISLVPAIQVGFSF